MSQQPDTYTVNKIHFMPTSSNRLFVDKSDDAAAIISGKDAEIKCYKLLTESQERRIANLAANCRGLDEARATLESERAANEQLTNTIAQQSERIAELEREPKA